MTVEEFSWGKAFGYALRYIAFVILWYIIGGLIMVAGVAMMLSAVSLGPPYYMPTFNPGAVIGGIIVIIIGLIITILGSMAAYFKIMSRLISEATSKPLPPPPRT
ncbi:hypothetical protein KEJ17_06275 [Candidatus Bathyarchaeota archaeon]|nr:hypothetical protein [Candidatus Bathyarchaeota archaeon]